MQYILPNSVPTLTSQTPFGFSICYSMRLVCCHSQKYDTKLILRIDFHCMLAISASSPKHPNETSQTSAAALVHLSKSYSLINARISGPDPVSNSTIAAVTSLIIYQRLQDQRSTGLIHFDGLCRMIELRGGMAELSKDNRSLAQKPFR